MAQEKINIRPGVSILSVLKHLNYKPWYALAEFVDNSIQSYLTHQKELKKVGGKKYQLKVAISIDTVNNKIVIIDNAAGIHKKDFQRAFRAAEIPPDTKGLSEFGMGMKSAACWFSSSWSVRTSALGEGEEKTIIFDINKIVGNKIEALDIKSKKSRPEEHFTTVTLDKLHHIPVKKTTGKIKEHLESIYRDYIRNGILELKFNNEILKYTEPKILKAPHYKNEKGKSIEWRKELNFDFGKGFKAKGFAALREVGSVSEAGFALLRRGRVIEGSGDEGFRPEYIFAKNNSFTFQRLFGELELEGFDVSHTKDGFRWDENVDIFLEYLKKELNRSPMPLLDQAEGYRKRKAEEVKKDAEKAMSKIAETLKNSIPSVLNDLRDDEVDNAPIPKTLPKITDSTYKEVDLELNNSIWRVHLELSYASGVDDWIDIGDHLLPKTKLSKSVRNIGIRISLVHPFMERYIGADSELLEPIIRLGAALGLAEVVARESAAKSQSEIRKNLNELLMNGFSKV